MRPYRYLFWGFLAVYFPYPIQPFSWLLSLFGAIAIAFGVARLASRSAWFYRVRTVAFLLIVQPIVSFFAVAVRLHGFGFATSFFGQTAPATRAPAHWTPVVIHPSAVLSIMLGVLSYVWLALSFLLVYGICKGTAEVATSSNQFDLVSLAMRRWKMWWIGNLIALLAPFVAELGFFGRFRPQTLGAALLFAWAGLVAVLVLFLVFLWKANVLTTEPVHDPPVFDH